jgi:lysyl-tRNA synthetase, class II
MRIFRSLTFRQSAALGVAAVGLEAALSAITPSLPGREQVLERFEPAFVGSLAHLLTLVAGLALVALAPKLWRGTSMAVPLAIGGLSSLAALNIVKGLDFDESALDVCFCALLVAGRGAFPLGCRKRPRLAAVSAAIGAWALVYCALLVGPLLSDNGRTIGHTLKTALPGPQTGEPWIYGIELLIVAAIVTSLVAVRSWLRPAAAEHSSGDEYAAARALVEHCGEDSLAPFILRPDKTFHFGQGGVLAYRVIRETAIVSGDPVARDEEAVKEVVASFRSHARACGWEVVLWGASTRHLEAYRQMGLRAICLGEEAVVRPAEFTLEGRRVRKLRQSVHRLERLRWESTVCEARDLDDQLRTEIDAFEARWRASQRRIIGFSMGMGPWNPELKPSDVYALGRAPDGELRAVIRFAEHRGRLSLDTMHRLGETPNGLTEALICRALEWARVQGIEQVSLNYAGLGHLFRAGGARTRSSRVLGQLMARLLGRRFQLARLVRFDEKFQPSWRQRFLVYESAGTLPLAAVRVLQAEGYLPGNSDALRSERRAISQGLPGSPAPHAAR